MNRSPNPRIEVRQAGLRRNVRRGMAAVAGALMLITVTSCGNRQPASGVRAVSTEATPQTGASPLPTDAAVPAETPATAPPSTTAPIPETPAVPSPAPVRVGGALFTVELPTDYRVVSAAEYPDGPKPPGMTIASKAVQATGEPVDTFEVYVHDLRDLRDLSVAAGGSYPTLAAGQAMLAAQIKDFDGTVLRPVTSSTVAGEPAITYAYHGVDSGLPFITIVVVTRHLDSVTAIVMSTGDSLDSAQQVLDALLSSWQWG